MFQQTGSKCADLSASNNSSGTVIFSLSVNFYTIVTRVRELSRIQWTLLGSLAVPPRLDYQPPFGKMSPHRTRETAEIEPTYHHGRQKCNGHDQ